MTIKGSLTRRISMMTCLYCFVASAGCSHQQQGDEPLSTGEGVPYVTSQELSDRVSSAQQPVLVEFSVPAGCFRCDEMREQLDRLARDAEARVQVCRVNLNYERALTGKLGITVCPTYVAFDRGQEAFRVTYPTSGDMLAAQLEGLTAAP